MNDRAIDRRGLIGLAAAALSGLAPLPAAGGDRAVAAATLDAFLDTLLPADAASPAAGAAGVGPEIRAIADGADDPRLKRLLALGTEWLDGLDARPFAALPATVRTRVLAWMEGADRGAVPGRFFLVVRTLAVEIYYARAEAIAGFPISVAPQPAGYPPPWG